MKWTQRDELTWQRECGRYSARRELLHDAKGTSCRWVWRPWFKAAPNVMAEMLDGEPHDSHETAIAVCTDHLRNHTSRPSAA